MKKKEGVIPSWLCDELISRARSIEAKERPQEKAYEKIALFESLEKVVGESLPTPVSARSGPSLTGLAPKVPAPAVPAPVTVSKGGAGAIPYRPTHFGGDRLGAPKTPTQALPQTRLSTEALVQLVRSRTHLSSRVLKPKRDS